MCSHVISRLETNGREEKKVGEYVDDGKKIFIISKENKKFQVISFNKLNQKKKVDVTNRLLLLPLTSSRL